MPLDQWIIDLYDEYTHEGLERRVFLERAAKITGSVAAAAAAFDMIAPNYALAQMVKPDDARLDSKMVTWQGGDLMTGYLVRPKGATKLPGVVVIRHCVDRRQARPEPMRGGRAARERRALRSQKSTNRGIHRRTDSMAG